MERGREGRKVGRKEGRKEASALLLLNLFLPYLL